MTWGWLQYDVRAAHKGFARSDGSDNTARPPMVCDEKRGQKRVRWGSDLDRRQFPALLGGMSSTHLKSVRRC